MSKFSKDTKRWIFYNFYVKPKYLADLILNPAKYYNQPSFFPEQRRKSNFRIWLDQVCETLKYGYPNQFYFPYGFDVKHTDEIKEYLHYAPFMHKRDMLNSDTNTTKAILRNKMLFAIFTDFFGIKSAFNYGVSQQEGIFDFKKKELVQFEDFFHGIEKANLFIKPIDGECGEGIFTLEIENGIIYPLSKICINFSCIIECLKSHRCLIQEKLVQHNVLSNLHPESINTIRLVTIRNQKTKKVEVFPSILRIGTGKSFVDNTSQGGIAVGIDLNSGQLCQYGFYKPGYGTKVENHPNSGIKFSDIFIPYFKECKEQAILLHNMLPDLQAIGWDIAIGKESPIFIEGNDNWEINGPQICNGGLKSKFFDLLYDTNA